MNLKEALISAVNVPAADSVLEKALIDNDLNGTDSYTKDSAGAIDKIAIDVLLAAWVTPDVSEGSYSVKYDRNAIKSRLLFLAKKHDRQDVIDACGDPVPTISSPNVW